MNLPEVFLEKIEKLCEGVSSIAITKAYANLSSRYRRLEEVKGGVFIENDLERLAYLIARFPATYAVNAQIAKQFMEVVPDAKIQSFLDLGAGSGAASLAWFHSSLPIQHMTLVEQDFKLISLGKALYEESSMSENPPEWLELSMQKIASSKAYDLILMSYSLNELKTKDQLELFKKLHECQPEWIVLVEPGSSESYENLMRSRDYFIKLGYFVLAPCPHEKPCPLLGKDWCHFSTRLPRTSLHKMMKQAERGYEDEKFSYVILSKKPPLVRYSRIIDRPEVHSGFVKLRVCISSGKIEQPTVTKKNKEFFKVIKKIEWGDSLDSKP